MPCRRWLGPDRGKAGRADRRMDCTFAMKEVSRVQSKRAQAYQKLVERLSPKSDMAKGIFRAYWVGGAICVLDDATIADMKAKRARDKARDEAAKQKEAVEAGEQTDWKAAMKEWEEYYPSDSKS